MNLPLSHDLVDLAALVKPGFGFIGTAPDFAMSLHVDATLDRLEFAIEGSEPEFLSLAGISLFDAAGGKLVLADICAEVVLSSAYGSNSVAAMADRFLAGGSIHSDKEARPVLRIRLKHPVKIAQLSVSCTLETTPRRNRYLTVSGFLGETEAYTFRNSADEGLLRAFAEVCDVLGVRDVLEAPQLTAMERRDAIRRALLGKLEQGVGGWDLRQMMEFVPIYGQPHEGDRFHVSVCAAVLLEMLRKKQVVPTRHLRFMSAILSSDLRIELLKDETNRMRTLRTGEPSQVVLSKHSIHESRLLRDKEQYLAALGKVMATLDEIGVSPMLCYGTLLGAVRDKGFLAHDDDVDILYYDGSSSQEEARANSETVIRKLRDRGYVVRDIGKANFHVACDGTAIDVFFCWQDGPGRIALLMEKFQARSIDRDILLPVSQIDLYGHSFPVPARREAFLEARYGSDWPHPDPYHEWPWSIRQIVTALDDDLRKARTLRASTTRKRLNRSCMVAWGQRVGDPTPPKNSLPIVHVAKSLGFDAIELDVRLSSDLVPVLAHDDLLKGPDGQIHVSRTEAAGLRKFRLGTYRGEDAFIHPLADALPLVGDKDVLIDPRMGPDKLDRIRRVTDACSFDPRRLQFCVYDARQADALSRTFPESVLLYKIGKPTEDVGDMILDEVAAMGMDGVMLTWPLYDQPFADFLGKLRQRNLRVLYYIHGSGDPTRPYRDDRAKSLERMYAAGVDYITSTAWDLPIFKQIVGSS